MPFLASRISWLVVASLAFCFLFAFNAQAAAGDIDNDGIADASDNCPNMRNAGQRDSDRDGRGDQCDPDDDNDTVNDTSDNCLLNPNLAQTNTDSDALGDVCDTDDDGDGVIDTGDNCPLTSNATQANADGDAEGDACDTDDDFDGVADTSDNCVTTANADQADRDGDGEGDVCDDDEDGDGALDASDNCATTVNADQADLDGDGEGDACDDDEDGDAVLDTSDNCVTTANADQTDTDTDTMGDACDPDDDNDTLFDLTASQVEATTIASTVYYASSKLAVTWNAPPETVDHYVVTATDAVASSSVTASVTTTSTTLELLKSDTDYTVTVQACLDVSCSTVSAASFETGTARTSAEYWQVQGTADDFASATRAVSDAQTKAYAFRYGSGAGSLEGYVQIYYDSSPGSGVTIGTLSAPATDLASVTTFTSLGATYGFMDPSSAATLVSSVNTTQAVPLTSGDVRLYFEATDAASVSRIMYVDSADGYVGQDFNSDPAFTSCFTQADFDTGGGCEPTVVVGVEGDTVADNTGVTNARQFKIGYPMQTDWRWDQAVGTFMVLTVDGDPRSGTGCSAVMMNQAYAVWDGSDWDVQYDPSDPNCPLLWENMQAPAPVHLEAVRYKLYYEDPSAATATTGRDIGGPKKIIYADGTLTGDAAITDRDDWEDPANARDIHFLWPSGAVMSASDEDYLDDYVILTPTGDLDFQVMYPMMGGDTGGWPFIGVAELVNP